MAVSRKLNPFADRIRSTGCKSQVQTVALSVPDTIIGCCRIGAVQTQLQENGKAFSQGLVFAQKNAQALVIRFRIRHRGTGSDVLRFGANIVQIET